MTLKRDLTAFVNLTLEAVRGRDPRPLARAVTAALSRRGVGRALSLARAVVSTPARLSQQRRIENLAGRVERLQEHIASSNKRTAALQAEIASLRASAGSAIEGLEGGAEGTEGAPIDEGRPWLALNAGDPHYRSWVGPPESYDRTASMQVSLLLAAGLRETHRLVEVGCGSLRAGRMLIPYLLPGHYFGIEPDRWVVEEGIKHELGEAIVPIKRPSFRFVEDFSAAGFGVEFDFALAQSVFSHTYPDMTLTGLKGISEALAPDGKLFANFVEAETTDEDGSGWLYPGCTTYTWQRMSEMLEESGLVSRKVEWLPGMRWFVATKPGNEDEIDALADRLRPPVVESSMVGRSG